MSEKVLNEARAAELWEAVKGRSLPTRFLTQTEYDALSEEEKQADVVYLVDEPPREPVPLSVQEYDTEDGWHVRKWSNGYVEMLGMKAHAAPFNVKNGNMYQTQTFPSIEYPVPLAVCYYENVSIIGAGGISGGTTRLTAKDILTQTPEVYGLRPLTATSFAFNIMYQVVGRWK